MPQIYFCQSIVAKPLPTNLWCSKLTCDRICLVLSGLCYIPIESTAYCVVDNFHGYKFSLNRPKFRFQKFSQFLIFTVGESGASRLANGMAKSSYTCSNLSSLFQWRESSLIPRVRTCEETIASGLALLSGLCVCAYIALRFPGGLQCLGLAIKGTLTDTVLLVAI